MQQVLNQILNEVLNGEIIRYVIIGTTVLAVLFKVIESIIYIGLIKESENVPNSRNKLIKQMKLKYENCYKLNLGVNNVTAFVDRYMYKHKVCEISLHGFARLPIMIMLFNMILGLAAGALCYIFDYGANVGALYEVYGVASVILIILSGVILDAKYKRKLVHINLVEFFENSFSNHLAHEALESAVVTQSEEVEESKEINEEDMQELVGEIKSSRQKADTSKGKNLKEKKSKNSKNEDQAVIEEVLSQFLS